MQMFGVIINYGSAYNFFHLEPQVQTPNFQRREFGKIWTLLLFSISTTELPYEFQPKKSNLSLE